MGRRECLYEALQLGMIEFSRRSGASIPPRMKFEDAVVHVTGDKAELFGRIAHQDIYRVAHFVYRGQWLACFVLICG